MIEVMPKIPLFLMYRLLGWPKTLPINITITPSPRCNSRCLTCNIWMKREDELSVEEWDRVFHSLGEAPFWVTISGGEPFMFRDIVPLVQSFYKHCRPGIINIPTNSLMYNIITSKVESICKSCPDAQVIINLSLDGVGEKHDRIRGIQGNFQKFEQNLRNLRQLKLRNLSIGIHSVISRFNVDDSPELYEYALKAGADSYITEIAEQRVELDTVGLGVGPSVDKYSWAIDQLTERVERTQFHGVSKVTEAFRVEYYRLVKRILRNETQSIPCFAGWASAQIYANGEVWPCCVRADNLANLRDVDYDFRRIWFSPAADRVRASIKGKECHCPLANASYTNMLMDIPTLARVGGKVALGSLPRVNRPPAVAVSTGAERPAWESTANTTHGRTPVTWLQDHFRKCSGPEYAQRALVRYRIGLRAGGAIGGVYVSTARDSCAACRSVAGQTYDIEDAPVVPVPECTHPDGCRCTYRPRMTYE